MHAVIQPVSVLGRGEANELHVVAHVSPNREASLEWSLRTDKGEAIHHGLVGLTGDEYSAWGTDDTYVFTKVAEKLNLTVVEILEPPPPPPFVPPADTPVDPSGL